MASYGMAYRLVLYHHERWDGTGYPMGLAGEQIPVEARIMSLSDVYDALLSKRVYKNAMGYEETRHEIRRLSGTSFDPVMIEPGRTTASNDPTAEPGGLPGTLVDSPREQPSEAPVFTLTWSYFCREIVFVTEWGQGSKELRN